MMPVLRFVLRLVFFPIGLMLLVGTAAMEAMSSDPDWNYWRFYNAGVLDAMWLGKYAS